MPTSLVWFIVDHDHTRHPTPSFTGPYTSHEEAYDFANLIATEQNRVVGIIGPIPYEEVSQ